MINFLHLSALLSLTLALCLQRNAKKMNGANISPSFYSFFIFFSIFVLILLLLPSFPFLSLSFFLSYSCQFLFLSCRFFLPFPFFLPSFLSFFLSYSILFFFLLFFSFVCSSCLYLCFALSFLVFLFSFLLFCSSFFRRVRSTAKVPYRQRQASSQTLCPLSQSTISVRNLTRHASLCLLHCRLLCKL